MSYRVTSVGTKVEYGSSEWNAYQNGATIGPGKAAPQPHELLELKTWLEEQLREKHLEDAAMLLAEAESEAYLDRQRKRRIEQLLNEC